MGKPRIIIADIDENYIDPLQMKFAEEFFEKIDLEIITDREYFELLFSVPQKLEVLIVSDSLYSPELQRHNISHIFVMNEQEEEERTTDLSINYIFKYTSIKEIFNKIIGKSADVLHLKENGKQETQVVLFCSASGGVGKTTLAMGVGAALTKSYKRVLYINASYLQVFQHLVDNPAAITTSDIYAKLLNAADDIYSDIQYTIRKESFSYLPPFKAALPSIGLEYSIYRKLIRDIKKSEEYDFIIVDTDSSFDEEKAILMEQADKVVVITKQNMASVWATNLFVANVDMTSTEKYIFLCNDFDKEADNALVKNSPPLKFVVSDYIEHFEEYGNMKPDDFGKKSSIKKVAFLVT